MSTIYILKRLHPKALNEIYLGLRVIARVVDGEVGKDLRRWTGR